MTDHHIRSRAGNLLSSGSNYLASRDWQGMANSLRQRVTDVNQSTARQSESQTSNPSWRSFHSQASSGAPALTRSAPRPSPSLAQFRSGDESPVLLPGWAQRKVARDRHPQSWARPDAPEDLEDGEIELQISIDGFVSKTLAAPTKSQRFFNQMARQLAGLPKLPPESSSSSTIYLGNAGPMTDEPQDVSASNPSPMQEEEQEHSLRGRAISKLMEGADEETLIKLMENIGAFPTESSSAEAASRLEGRSRHSVLAEHADTIDPRAESSATLHLPRPSRSSTSSSASSSTSFLGGSIYWSDRSPDELRGLHQNLSKRLHSYWIYRSGGKDVRIEIAPVVHGQAVKDQYGQRLLLAATRLTTDSTGQFSHRLIIPWHMLSNFCSHHSSLRIQPNQIEGVEVRAALAADRHGSIFAVQVGVDPDEITTDWIKYPLEEDGGSRVRVISDVDDTVKHTGVLHGTKHILRNVFVLPFHECAIPGVANWYQAMVRLGVGLHYVTNAPLELHRLVHDFFAAINLPIGHLTLKHYPMGTRNLLSSWMEPAGERKRANVVKILDEFSESQFILIGDSGELDLELYTALAAERPAQVRGIFIRDVSSPRPGLGKTSTSTSIISSKSTASKALDAVKRLPGPPVAALAVRSTSPDFFEPSYPPRSGTLDTISTSGLTAGQLDDDLTITDVDMRRKQAFQYRLLRATSMVPRSTVFRLFWEGSDVEEGALKLIRELQGGKRPADRH